MANKQIKIGNTFVAENSSPYMIAEIGINHNGDIQIAKKLIDAANATGWDNVKFKSARRSWRCPRHKNPFQEKHHGAP